MSNLLRDAIVDAKALREAALKNAETVVIDKYAVEVRETLENLLEQEAPADPLAADPMAVDPMAGDPLAVDPMAAGAPLGGDPLAGAPAGDVEDVAESNIPLAATDNFSDNKGRDLNHLPRAGEDVDVTINLDALQEAVIRLQEEQEYDLKEEELAALLSEDEAEEDVDIEGKTAAEGSAEEVKASSEQFEDSDEGGEGPVSEEKNEEIDISDELIDEIVERLTVDMGATLKGWAGRSSEDMKWEMEKALAQRRSTDFQDELETLKKAQEELVFENKQLKESLKQYKQATTELKEGIHDVNLSNARLLYTNRVLRNTSLNERQKTKIADAISKAGSVTEAKTIYQTLESTVESTTQRGPQSLREAIGRRTTSVIRASRQESTSSDPLQERMKRLAGIK